MRSSAAIGLVLLGGGVVTTAVMLPKQCKDPLTGQPIACSSSGSHGSSYSSWGSHSGSSSSVSSAGSVSRGGFGSAGASASAGS